MITVRVPNFAVPSEEQLYTGDFNISKRVSASEAHTKLRRGLYQVTIPNHASIVGLIPRERIYHELAIRNWENEEVAAKLIVPYNNPRKQRCTSTSRAERARILGGTY